MPSKNNRHLLLDILASLDYIRSFADPITFDDYLADRKTRSAVERELLIVSEAAIRFGPEAETIWRVAHISDAPSSRLSHRR